MRVSKKVRRRIQLKQRKQATARRQIYEQPDKADLQKADVQQASRVADNEQWVEQNFSECNFGHVLRTQRLMMMAKNMLECPNESLPKQNVDWSDVKAAYRFLNRKEMTTMEDGVEPLIGLISVVGVRLLSLKTISRHEPEAKAKDRVLGLWLKALLLMKPKLARQELTVYDFFRELAKLGGFLARKHDGEPGWQSIWTGYKKLYGRIQGMKLLMS